MVPEDAVSSMPSAVDHQLNLPDKGQVMEEFRRHGAQVCKTQDILDWLQ
jgi:hypothetical protein